jgi:26S proteasome regulatory subunit N1
LIDAVQRIGHDTDLNVANNSALAIGLIAAGTENTRAIAALRQLRDFQRSNQTTISFIHVAEGLVHLGQGLMTLSPTYGDSMLVHPVAIASLSVIAAAAVHPDDLLVKTDPLLLYFIAPAIGPRFLVTLDENLEILPISVRVGTAIDVVGQAGRPRAITGFQTLKTPVVLAAGQRAEFVNENIVPLTPVLEGFVIVRMGEGVGSTT